MGADRLLVAADRDGRLRELLRGDDEPTGPRGNSCSSRPTLVVAR
jgi:hypothetical protein